MTYSVPRVAGEAEVSVDRDHVASQWPLWEVFIRQRRGLSHVHVGSLHAPDAETALLSARDVYTRRVEGISLWVVASRDITASDPDDADSFFGSIEKPYRHATHYDIPDEVGQM
ncbi:MAG TPA: 1,2-phenylacetyl-CoA epoxidase subunit PaaB [Acidimicrobiia bacterium]|nr:1,2-phenylacetyl-CoA epoxidase subunit PaaB [Acidimicrobiia bacterium]